MVRELPFVDDVMDLDALDAIQEQLDAVPADTDHVRLRGFMAIEKMLGLFNHAYTRNYNKPALVLSARSWHALTELLREIEKILDTTTLDVTEHELGGIIVATDNTVLVTHRAAQAGFNDVATKAVGVSRVQTLARCLDTSIHTLRPYLRNGEVLVGVVGDSLATAYREMYGMMAVVPLIEVTRELLDVRL